MSVEPFRGRIFGCECGGLWLTKEACTALAELTLSPDELAFVVSTDKRVAKQAQTYRNAAAVRCCPVCEKKLGRSRVEHTIDTLDICRAHGTFFDPQEASHLDEALRALAVDAEPGLLKKLLNLVGL